MFLRDKEQPLKNLMLFTYLRKTQLAWWIEIRTEIPPALTILDLLIA